eukprot:CAMPEP_0204532170 /NCGR_PEP_ID=MMETSP0661-20131031/11577_1 /ASSEMBLY_ACC=CAM_ASM_000606 /TAXON_ID=109239 /ORGANISM="Alexandrium margalefi, Strain AMGDE01CS-322" /LENGTH=330 /DNA_ID=CAMNT_0051538391 /DNA_START=162 /DNA_END=1150 /DNA_ORIENTATION=-
MDSTTLAPCSGYVCRFGPSCFRPGCPHAHGVAPPGMRPMDLEASRARRWAIFWTAELDHRLGQAPRAEAPPGSAGPDAAVGFADAGPADPEPDAHGLNTETDFSFQPFCDPADAADAAAQVAEEQVAQPVKSADTQRRVCFNDLIVGDWQALNPQSHVDAADAAEAVAAYSEPSALRQVPAAPLCSAARSPCTPSPQARASAPASSEAGAPAPRGVGSLRTARPLLLTNAFAALSVEYDPEADSDFELPDLFAPSTSSARASSTASSPTSASAPSCSSALVAGQAEGLLHTPALARAAHAAGLGTFGGVPVGMPGLAAPGQGPLLASPAV